MSKGYTPASNEAGAIPGEGQFGMGCIGKRQFTSKRQAEGGLRVLLRKVQVRNAHLMNTYKCRSCRHWHYGHRPGGLRHGQIAIETSCVSGSDAPGDQPV